MTITVCTWLWGKDKYGPSDVAKLAAGFRRHLKQPHRFVCLVDAINWPRMGGVSGIEVFGIWDEDLLKVKGCFARLRLFDPKWQARFLPAGGDPRIVCADLDSVVTGSLDVLFDRPEPFMILTGANASNPCPYNGSLWMLRAGYRADVWKMFSLDAVRAIPHHEFPDDQGFFAHTIPGVTGWKVGAPSGVYAFQKPGWPKGDDLPKDARMVVFPGWRDPKQFEHLPWVQEFWQ